MNIKTTKKRLAAVFLIACLTFTLTGCADKYEKRYQTYVKSLIAINYLGATDDYIKSTGANKKDAASLYQGNAKYLANNILSYYSIQLDQAPDMYDQYVDLAKTIYSKVNYKVSRAYKKGTQYCVDITIYPIDLFAQTSGDVKTYVDTFNEKVAAGEYNSYTMDQYETEFAAGMLEILKNGTLAMKYCNPVTVTVTIITDGDTYYIGDHDFMLIDAAMINASSKTATATSSDAPTE